MFLDFRYRFIPFSFYFGEVQEEGVAIFVCNRRHEFKLTIVLQFGFVPLSDGGEFGVAEFHAVMRSGSPSIFFCALNRSLKASTSRAAAVMNASSRVTSM